MPQDSLKKRYASKLISNSVKVAVGFVTVGMVPRALGPEAYGNFGFLTNFFISTVKFLTFGIPTAYYTKLSKRQNEKKLIGFYIYFGILLMVIVFITLLGIVKFGLQEIIWPDQKGIFIFASALLAVLYFITESFRNTNDAFGYTFRYEKAFILQSIITGGLIVALYFTNVLTLSSYFLMLYFLSLFVIISGWRVLRIHKIYLSKQLNLARNDLARYIKEFYHFSHPLFFQSLVVYVVVITDRWLLQTFYGSAEQGFYTIALKIGSIIFLITSSITPLMLREMSLSYKDRKKEELKRLFKRFIPIFYFIIAYFSVFISLNAETVNYIIGGSDYKNASIVISILVLYPIHQTYGQLAGSVFLATEQTKVLRNIGIITGLVGFVISLLFLMPIKFYGLGLGAIGLAIKMVLIQFISVNIYLWIIARFLNLSFHKFFGHQLIVIAVLFIFSKFSQYLSGFISTNIIFTFLISGFIYTLLVFSLIIIYPRVIVLTRKAIRNYIKITLENLMA